MKTLKYTVVSRTNPDAPQEETEFFTKSAADAYALQVYLKGGIAMVIEDMTDDFTGRNDNEEGIY